MFVDGSTASSSSLAPRYAAAATRSTSAWVRFERRLRPAAATAVSCAGALGELVVARVERRAARAWSAASRVCAAASSAEASAPRRVAGQQRHPEEAGVDAGHDRARARWDDRDRRRGASGARRSGREQADGARDRPRAEDQRPTSALPESVVVRADAQHLALQPPASPGPEDRPFCPIQRGAKSANRAGRAVRVGPVVRFDPYSYEHHEDPYPTYRRLRDEAPAYLDPERGFWALSRHDDVRAAIDDWPTFSSTGGITLERRTENVEPMLIEMDPPRHTELRSLVSRAFTPRRVADLEAPIRDLAHELVDGLRRPEPGSTSSRTSPRKLPMAVISVMLGVPRDGSGRAPFVVRRDAAPRGGQRGDHARPASTARSDSTATSTT